MQMGKIVGTVVSTIKNEKLDGLRFQLVKYVDSSGAPTGSQVVAVDSVGAGVGDIVLIASGSSARLTDRTEGKPVDAVIMAIVDILEVEGEKKYVKS